MRNILLHWILSAIAVWVVSQVVPGFAVASAGAALIAALVIGLINGTLGIILKILTLPLTIMTFGLFLLVINALMLMLAANVIPGFHIDNFVTAFIGSIVLSIVSAVLRLLLPDGR